MRGMPGVIHREADAELIYHENEHESAVVVRATHTVPGTTSHQVTPLSIEAATELYNDLGEILAEWNGTTLSTVPAVPTLEERITTLESRLSRTLEVNELWDGS